MRYAPTRVLTTGAVTTAVATASRLGVGHVDANTAAVELLLVHGVDGGVSLGLRAVGLCKGQRSEGINLPVN